MYIHGYFLFQVFAPLALENEARAEEMGLQVGVLGSVFRGVMRATKELPTRKHKPPPTKECGDHADASKTPKWTFDKCHPELKITKTSNSFACTVRLSKAS